MKLEKLALKKEVLSKESMSVTYGGKMAAGTITGGECSMTASTGCYDCSGSPD
jgi:hypothetical protein